MYLTIICVSDYYLVEVHLLKQAGCSNALQYLLVNSPNELCLLAFLNSEVLAICLKDIALQKIKREPFDPS